MQRSIPMAARSVCRSREGAWIEIDGYVIDNQIRVSRSREGAWIEIADSYSVAEAVKASLP